MLRSTAVYALLGAIVACAIVAVIALLPDDLTLMNSVAAGQVVLAAFAWSGLAFAGIYVAPLAYLAAARDLNRRNLEFLLVTPLGLEPVMAGKLLFMLFLVVLSLVVLAPFAALPMLLKGVDLGQILTVCAICIGAGIALSICGVVSALITRGPIAGIPVAVGAAAMVILGLPLAVAALFFPVSYAIPDVWAFFWLLSPFFAVQRTLSDPDPAVLPIVLGYLFGVSSLTLVICVFRLRYVVCEQARSTDQEATTVFGAVLHEPLLQFTTLMQVVEPAAAARICTARTYRGGGTLAYAFFVIVLFLGALAIIFEPGASGTVALRFLAAERVALYVVAPVAAIVQWYQERSAPYYDDLRLSLISARSLVAGHVQTALVVAAPMLLSFAVHTVLMALDASSLEHAAAMVMGLFEGLLLATAGWCLGFVVAHRTSRPGGAIVGSALLCSLLVVGYRAAVTESLPRIDQFMALPDCLVTPSFRVVALWGVLVAGIVLLLRHAVRQRARDFASAPRTGGDKRST